MLRLAGYFPVWGIVALALVLHDWVPRTLTTLRQASRRGLLLFWSAALGGIVAEVLKLTLRRERPGLTDGLHVPHFMSDVVLAAFVGYVVAWIVWRRRSRS